MYTIDDLLCDILCLLVDVECALMLLAGTIEGTVAGLAAYLLPWWADGILSWYERRVDLIVERPEDDSAR